MPGSSPSDLSAAATWFRQRRIYDASQLYNPGSVREPRRPYLRPGTWKAAAAHFHKNLSSVDPALPSVFTRYQSYVAGALMFLWYVQGPEARFTYDELELIIYALVRVDGNGLDKISRDTITRVLYMLHDSGAAKYVPGFPGVKSSIQLVDLTKLCSMFPTRSHHQVTYPHLQVTYPHLPATHPAGPAAPTLGYSRAGFLEHGYWSLLGEVYRSVAVGTSTSSEGSERGKVTRFFNKALAGYGIKGYRVREYLPKLNYPTQTWYVNSTDENNWQVQAAVNATRNRFLPSQMPAERLTPSKLTQSPERLDEVVTDLVTPGGYESSVSLGITNGDEPVRILLQEEWHHGSKDSFLFNTKVRISAASSDVFTHSGHATTSIGFDSRHWHRDVCTFILVPHRYCVLASWTMYRFCGSSPRYRSQRSRSPPGSTVLLT